MVSTKKSKAVEEEQSQYEASRAQRIKENMERMKTLGIADLSKNLKPPSLRKIKPQIKPSRDPPRRSSRSHALLFSLNLQISSIFSLIRSG